MGRPGVRLVANWVVEGVGLAGGEMGEDCLDE